MTQVRGAEDRRVLDTDWCAAEACLALGAVQHYLTACVAANVIQVCHAAGQRHSSTQTQGNLTEDIFTVSLQTFR